MNQPCPECGGRMLLDFATSQVKCTNCGHIREDEISKLAEVQHKARETPDDPGVYISITRRNELSPYAMAAFDAGHEAWFKGDKAAARKHFQDAIDSHSNFVEAYLWLAKSTDDPTEQRDLLGTVLTISPGNLEAIRMLMVLDGRLTPEQAAQTYHFNDQRVQQAGDVTAKSSTLICPKCGGDLTELDQRVECRFCGYTALRAQTGTGSREDSLTMALLERKAQPVHWNVGNRIIKCQQCGAEHTLPAEKMSQRCRFCGSTHVMVSDALRSFEQPSRIIPFKIDESAARESINRQLKTLGERFLNIFDSNKVERGIIEGVYLPYWIFDILGEVTTVQTMPPLIEVSRSTGAEMIDDIGVCAVKSPPQELTAQLGSYNVSDSTVYDPKWLAKYPAQMYSIDFDAASIEAHALAGKAMKAKRAALHQVEIPTTDRERKITTTVYTNVQSMTFQLALVPVWIATLIEVDGDERLALVNGQTGKVVLGKVHKAKR
jgi:DNA-directed RNA polymerase subunit RPC12/RpoP